MISFAHPGWVIGGFLPFTLPREMSKDAVFPLQFTSDDEKWMCVALLNGMNGSGLSNPNPSVGCVLVKNNSDLASGNTEAYRFRHAERVAIDSIPQMKDLSGVTAYITLEPCSHQGHQPPCVDLLIQKKVSRVVIATSDPNPLVLGQGLEKLKKAGIETSVGVLKNEAALWHLPFLAHQILKRPVFIGKWAQSKNGLLANDTGESKWISGPASRAYGHWLREKYDAVLVGAGTVLKDSPKLTVRDCRQPVVRQPLRIVVDLRKRITEINQGLLNTTFSDKTLTVLIIPKGTEPPTNFPKHAFLTRTPTLDPVEAVQNWVSSKEASDLFGKPLQSVYVEGGPALLQLFLSKKAFDIVHVFTSTQEISGKRYALSFDASSQSLRQITHTKLQEDLLTEFAREALMDQL